MEEMGDSFSFPLGSIPVNASFRKNSCGYAKNRALPIFFFQSAEAIGKKCREISSKLFSTVS